LEVPVELAAAVVVLVGDDVETTEEDFVDEEDFEMEAEDAEVEADVDVEVEVGPPETAVAMAFSCVGGSAWKVVSVRGSLQFVVPLG